MTEREWRILTRDLIRFFMVVTICFSLMTLFAGILIGRYAL